MSERTPPEFRPSFEPPPPAGVERTALVEVQYSRGDGRSEVPDLPDLPDAHDVPVLPDLAARPPPMPLDPLDRPHTSEHFAMETVDESNEMPSFEASAVRRRQPAPQRKRPTLLPKNLPSIGTGAGRERKSSGVMRPVHGRQDDSRPGLGTSGHESSDVVSTFESGELNARPEPLRPDVPSNRRALLRQSGGARRPPARRPAPAQPQPAQHPHGSRAAPPQRPPVLPIPAESLAMLIADQRRRLHLLDGFARGLEIGAGVLGTLALAVLIASLVSILVGTDVSVLTAAGALVGAATSLALTLVMVVAAIGLRQIAHMSAQLAALLEALSNRR